MRYRFPQVHKVLRHLDPFDGRQDIRAWLFAIARNCYYSDCRKRSRSTSLEELPAEPADAGQPDLEELLADKN